MCLTAEVLNQLQGKDNVSITSVQHTTTKMKDKCTLRNAKSQNHTLQKKNITAFDTRILAL